MEEELISVFSSLWESYFPGEALPVTFGITPDPRGAEVVRPREGRRCFVCDLAAVSSGRDRAFSATSVTCAGGKRYCGFTREIFPAFRYFLSTGQDGGVEGERYKKSPELVDAWSGGFEPIPSAGQYLLFRRWDHLTAEDNPAVVIFFARPEVLSGLFTLANFDRADPYGVITPMGAGCSTIVHYPYLEEQSADPRAVIGMMDPSARPCVPVDVLTCAVPMKKFIRMVRDMKESFLITHTWEMVQKKMALSRAR